MEVLGWKDVLRPIRDGYRKIFPSPDTGPTPEERERQRALDQLKGFTYFDTFEQLDIWTTAETDAIGRANTPLLKRPPIVEEAGEKANLLLCHDYSGNYHDYEAAQGAVVHDESYSCEYLQFVDTFVYFSHKLVCVPPPSWTNSLHRNGVKVLGTFLIEPQTQDIERLLQHNKVDGIAIFPIAQKLADIARHYGFDGWLLNIEKTFVNEVWDPLALEAFLHQLRSHLGVDGQLIWYDALTISNKIIYQNALTPLNLPFTKACGSVLTNYCWTESHALNSKQLALSNLIPTDCVFFGVDVWAQNATSLGLARTTYGGGGTRTGVAVTKLAEMRLSVGVFAPAWSFEHFPGHGRALESALWDGTSIPENIDCACSNTEVRHPRNREHPITRSSREFAAGSSNFFYTDFARAFSRHQNGRNQVWEDEVLNSQLASQSILPHVSNTSYSRLDIGGFINILSIHLEDSPGSTQAVIEARSPIPLDPSTLPATVNDGLDNLIMYESYLPLFNLNITTTEPLRIRFVYNLLLDDPIHCIVPSFYIRFGGDHSDFRDFRISRLGKNSIEASHVMQTGKIDEIGFHLIGPRFGQKAVRVAEITEICISPISQAVIRYSIDNIRFEGRGEGETRHKRLCWTFSGEASETPTSIYPYSEVTGPFSYFLVQVDGINLGRAYALEYVLSETLVEQLGKGKDVEVKIMGAGFDGRMIAEIWRTVVI